jgi:parallel beta-helix repeat protein
MFKRISYSLVFLLLITNFLYSQIPQSFDKEEILRNHPELQKLSYSQRIQKPREISIEAKQSLEERGIRVLGPAPKLVSPRKDSLVKDNDVVRVAVSFNLCESGIKPKYMGTSIQKSISSSTGIDTIMTDGFEMDFPGTKWQRKGNPTWGKTNYQKHTGGYSIWCAKDSSNGVAPGQSYLKNCHSMIIYGPFNLSNVNYAQLKFRNWSDTEYQKDWFYYMASTDRNNFQGVGVTGETSGWEEEILHLSNVPGLGNITGRSQVWIAFLFESDGNTTSDKGVFVDDVTLTKTKVDGTPIVGAISGKLSPSGNPYIAVNDVGVAEGDSLIIEPGVQVRFEEGYGLICIGSVNMIGTIKDSIVFISNKQNPKMGDWTGIEQYGKASQIKYARIQFASDGISSEASEGKVSNCLISKNQEGISVTGGNMTILDNIVTSNQHKGVIVSGFASAKIERTVITNHSEYGIDFYSAAGTLILVNSTIENNKEGGVWIGGWYGGLVIIKGNLVRGNGSFGIGLLTLNRVDLVNNLIIENSTGIEIRERYAGFTGNIINNCFIKNSKGIALNITNPESNLGGDFWGPIMNNIFYSNSIGIQFGMLLNDPNVYYNDFYNNPINFSGSVHDSLNILNNINANGIRCDKYYNIYSDPKFVNLNAQDYHLSYIEKGFPENSPCRDAGHVNVFYNDEADGTKNDMGAYGGSSLLPNLTKYVFDDLPVSYSKTVEMKIRNDREKSFTVSSLRLSDPVNFSISKTETFTLESFGETLITIDFHPKSIGDFTSELILNSTDFSGSNTAKIIFKGRGIKGTAVKGEISGTWTKDKSPYIVIGDLKVNKLIIEPGVIVKFDGWYYMRIYGILTAIGTKNDSIIFTRNRPTESSNGIAIITFSSSKNDSMNIKYCRIEYLNYVGANDNTTISHTTIKNCSSSGIRCSGFPLITNNNIISNASFYSDGSGFGGGIYVEDGSPIIINNLIVNNKANNGGGIGIEASYYWKQEPSPKIENNTIYGNIVNGNGGGIYIDHRDSVILKNNIIWSNIARADSQISRTKEAIMTITYSDIQGGWQGEGNINANPLFVNMTNGDYHLQPKSPCIDKGSPDIIYNDPVDPQKPGYALFPALGTLRNDMGAYGGQGAANWQVITSVSDSKEIANLPKEIELFQNYPNPINSETTIRYYLAESGNVCLKIMNLVGQEIKTLVNAFQYAGKNEVKWSVAGIKGGIYFYRLQVGSNVETKRMIVLK